MTRWARRPAARRRRDHDAWPQHRLLGGRASRVVSETARRLDEWPEDPCAVLSAAEVAAATGIEVIDARRTPSLAKTIQAARDGREPGPGAFICSYETRSDVGAVTIIVPPPGERSAESYRANRDAYLRRYPGSGRRISGLGRDAWIGGGTTLRVLVRDDLHFAVATQTWRPRSETLVVAVAPAVLARL